MEQYKISISKRMNRKKNRWRFYINIFAFHRVSLCKLFVCATFHQEMESGCVLFWELLLRSRRGGGVYSQPGPWWWLVCCPIIHANSRIGHGRKGVPLRTCMTSFILDENCENSSSFLLCLSFGGWPSSFAKREMCPSMRVVAILSWFIFLNSGLMSVWVANRI